MTQTPGTDPTSPDPQSTAPPASAASALGVSDIPADEIAKGKLFALLSYAGNFVQIPFWIVPLFMRDNRFSLYHAKQCLTLFIFTLPAIIISIILIWVCVGAVLLPLIGIANIVLLIMGMINVSNNVTKPLPLIGGLAERWFEGIKVNKPGTPV